MTENSTTKKFGYFWRVLATFSLYGIMKFVDYLFTIWQQVAVGSLGADQLNSSNADYIQFMMYNKFINGSSLSLVFGLVILAVWWKPAVNLFNSFNSFKE